MLESAMYRAGVRVPCPRQIIKINQGGNADEKRDKKRD
jgi:hypothetical protein